MTRRRPPREMVVRVDGGSAGDSAEWRVMGVEKVGTGSPGVAPYTLSDAVGSLGVGPEACKAAVTQPVAFSAGPQPRLTSSCSLSLSPASRRSLPLDFSSAPLGAVAGGC